jgi:muconate cycloisomerase
MTGETVESMMAAIRHLAPHLSGVGLEDIGAISKRMNRLMYGNKGAKSAIEIGFHDVLGKAQGKPVHDLIGEKRRSRVPMIQMLATSNVEADVAEAHRSKALGYVAFKVKVGTGDPRVDADRTRRVCEALGPDVLRCSDANQGWSVDQALEYVRALEGSGLDFFEQPVMADDLEGMAKIAAATDIAIGCDEGVHCSDDLRRHHEARAARGASLKGVKLGGLRGVIDAAALCEVLGMKVNLAGKMCESGIATAAVLHLAAAVPSLDWSLSPTSPYLAEDVLAKPLVFANGHAEVPTGPGLGIEVDERQVRKFTIER